MRVAVMIAAAGLLTAAAPPPEVSPEQADRFLEKVALIVEHGESKSGARQTPLTEGEVNSYLRYRSAPHLPVGVTDPSIGIVGQGRLHGRAIVDLDQIRKKKGTGGWFDPISYLTGRLPVTASGTLHTKAGKGRFDLATAEVSGIPVPKTVLQEIVSFYTRSGDDPDGINIDDIFDLPAAIDRIQVEKGRAIVVQ